MEPRTYLGDGVYAEFDGYQIWLITSDGIHNTNRIALEPAVMQNLEGYARGIYRQLASPPEEGV